MPRPSARLPVDSPLTPRYGCPVASDREDEVREDQDIDEQAREEETSSDSEPPSDLDAMGRDKRRGVVGGQYGATKKKQLTVYGIFIAVMAVLIIGGLTIVSSIDNRERELVDTAPWTEASASQDAPRDLDFLENGPCDTIPVEDIGAAPGPDDEAAAECD
jgi:hypothetical protein